MQDVFTQHVVHPYGSWDPVPHECVKMHVPSASVHMLHASPPTMLHHAGRPVVVDFQPCSKNGRRSGNPSDADPKHLATAPRGWVESLYCLSKRCLDWHHPDTEKTGFWIHQIQGWWSVISNLSILFGFWGSLRSSGHTAKLYANFHSRILGKKTLHTIFDHSTVDGSEIPKNHLGWKEACK